MRLFTLIAEKSGSESILLQEDADSELMALRNALGRLPSHFPEEDELSIVGSVIDGKSQLELIKMPRHHSIWVWPNSSVLALSFKVVVIETVIART